MTTDMTTASSSTMSGQEIQWKNHTACTGLRWLAVIVIANKLANTTDLRAVCLLGFRWPWQFKRIDQLVEQMAQKE
jgi:hypothetical protein